MLVVQPETELRRADEEGCDGEPAPALPEQHADRRDERDRHEGERGRVGAGVGQHGREQRTDDPDPGHDRLAPAHGDRRGGRPDQRRRTRGRARGRSGRRAASRRRASRRARRSPSRRRRARPASGPGARAGRAPRPRSAVEPSTASTHPRRLVDPAAAGRHHEEEDDAEDDRRTADPGEHAGRRADPRTRSAPSSAAGGVRGGAVGCRSPDWGRQCRRRPGRGGAPSSRSRRARSSPTSRSSACSRASGVPAMAASVRPCESPFIEGFNFSTEVTVRFAETDAQAIAHHASFVVWLEVARVAYLAQHAGGYLAIQAGRDRGAHDRGARPLLPRRALRRPAPHLDAVRRPARRALPLRVRDRAARRATAPSSSPTATRRTRPWTR